MIVCFSSQFLKSATKLPLRIQEKLDHLVSVLEINPYDNLLHTKKLSGELAGYLSFRITRDWRVIFCFLEPQKIQLLRVAHRKEIYSSKF